MSQFFNNKKDIEAWLHEHDILDYFIQEDLSVNVHFHLDLSEKIKDTQEIIEYLPVQFSHIEGDCNFANLGLLSLKGSPHTVEGTFYCSNNGLASLEGGPKEVKGSYWADNNYLNNLIGSAQKIGYHFGVAKNQLTDLIGVCPEIGGSFYCQDNYLKTLENGPTDIAGEYCCSHNQLTSFKGLVPQMDITLICAENPGLTSLESLPNFENKKQLLIFEGTNIQELESFYQRKKENHLSNCSITMEEVQVYKEAWRDKKQLEHLIASKGEVKNTGDYKHKI